MNNVNSIRISTLLGTRETDFNGLAEWFYGGSAEVLRRTDSLYRHALADGEKRRSTEIDVNEASGATVIDPEAFLAQREEWIKAQRTVTVKGHGYAEERSFAEFAADWWEGLEQVEPVAQETERMIYVQPDGHIVEGDTLCNDGTCEDYRTVDATSPQVFAEQRKLWIAENE